MAENKSAKVCEAEENVCKKEVQALCYHCSKNLCRVHLMRHAQLIEEKIREELHSLTDKFNELSSRFGHLSISDDILQIPLVQLEKWRIEAHEKIDQIVKNKRRELCDEFDKYQKVFLTNHEEQLGKLNVNKKVLAELIEESDASATQIADLQRSIGETEKYLNALNAPVVNVIAQPLNCSIDICTNYSDTQATSIDNIREFKITYVRVNGLVRNYYVKTKENGKMIDLINSFIRHYIAIEEVTQIETNQIYKIDHLPNSDFILPIEIFKNRVHLQYTKNSTLSAILQRDIILFYETPYSLNDENNSRILMPCLFQHAPGNQTFGLPIYLSVPRKGCKGEDIRDALHYTLNKFYRPNRGAGQRLYDVYLQFTINNVLNKIKLDDALQKEMDFAKENVTLILAFDSQFTHTNEWSYYEEFHL